ncbi:preprotein translocase subunit SecE [Zavarzinella formosa]|uniref:preprotein translocase subunit SecE n=1 Tax=Zavarzinella formosa TaxID=360055 RepID=UPI000315AB86|nr:preprotein translocase subunit SecE [Zavarzinella formosa]
MAVAVQPTAEASKSAQPMGLIAASCVGAVFVLGAAALVLRIIPGFWESSIGRGISQAVNPLFSTALLVVVQVAAAVAIAIAGTKLAANQKTPGARGGIFFVISAVFTAFFCGRAIFLLAGRQLTAGTVVAMLVNAAILFFLVQFFRTGKFAEWSLVVDEGGLLSVNAYKPSQGLKVRRLTIVGLLLILGSGVWTLMTHNWIPLNNMIKVPGIDGEFSSRLGDWVIGFTEAKNPLHRVGGFTILPDLAFTIPMVLIAASIWFSWRAVNFPPFADFLIATEAEINKVSWTPRKALIRDTVVVLTSLVLITVFLFVIDVFWGWLLSRELVGVLPTDKEKPAVVKDNQTPLDW